VNENNGLGFDPEAAVVWKNAGDVNPVSVAVFVGGAARGGGGDETKRNAALTVIVNGAETDLVVAFVDGAVIEEFGGVEKMEAIHATAA
jgi:hypothetical protein